MDRTIRIFDLQQIHDKLPSFPAITLRYLKCLPCMVFSVRIRLYPEVKCVHIIYRSGRGIFCHDRGDNLLVAGMHSAVRQFLLYFRLYRCIARVL